MKSRIEVDTLAMSKSETQYRSEAVHASAVVDAITPREAAKILQVSRPCNRGTTTGTQVAGSPNAGGQTGDGNNRACANQAGRRRALT